MTKEEYIAALPIARKLYDRMFNDLVTGIENSIKNFDAASWLVLDDPGFVNKSSYYQGKRDAFREIASRLDKEHRLSEPNERHLIETLGQPLGQATDKDVDKVFPYIERSYMCGGSKVMQHRRVLANMLRFYFMEGFRIGCDLHRADNADIKQFNPDEFADMCSEDLINPYYLKEIKDSEQRDRTN